MAPYSKTHQLSYYFTIILIISVQRGLRVILLMRICSRMGKRLIIKFSGHCLIKAQGCSCSVSTLSSSRYGSKQEGLINPGCEIIKVTNVLSIFFILTLKTDFVLPILTELKCILPDSFWPLDQHLSQGHHRPPLFLTKVIRIRLLPSQNAPTEELFAFTLKLKTDYS